MLDFKYLSENWNKYTPPWTPSKENLKSIEVELYGNSMCILGATKGLRQIVKQDGIVVDIYDISSEMIDINKVNNNNEHIYIQDWLSMSGKKYDTILGDLILFLLPSQKQKELLSVLYNNLSPNGRIILRTGKPRLTKDINKFTSYINKLIYFNLQILNYISFELIVGLGYSDKDILCFLKEHNSLLYNFFQENFFHFVPYGNTKIESDVISSKSQTIYLKKYLLSEEKIIIFYKN